MTDNQHYRELLLCKRVELRLLSETTDEAASTVELDQSRVGRLSRMDALQAQSMSQESQRRNKLELIAIEQALKRIEDGAFGDCLECDEPIAPQRLELTPTATLCISCANNLEEV
ncbi:MAG: TraR/DksA family transcriptional regulator [Gammaproteobacteria bacterium]|nr:TraR/DksA family transcriptional regulator [Gammaproteobacteria bacterium]